MVVGMVVFSDFKRDNVFYLLNINTILVGQCWSILILPSVDHVSSFPNAHVG